MKSKFLSAINDFNMLSDNDTVVVGVSGGADSMCLLALLSECSEELGVRVIAAHYNHGIRGSEAERDEKFVLSYCTDNNIEVVISKGDVPAVSEKTGESTEECARRLRYEFLSSVCPGAKIATAHTASDSIETALMNFSRGSGLHGLCGIPAVRNNIIRPLIYFTRDDSERFCREHMIKYVTDSTNMSTEYTRNAMRLNVIPAIKEIYPSFSSNALRCMSIIRQEDEFLKNEASAILLKSLDERGRINLKELAGIHSVMLRRVVAMYIAMRLNRDVAFRHIELICEIIQQQKGALVLPGGEKIVCSHGQLYFDDKNKENASYLEMPIPSCGGKFIFFERTVEIYFSKLMTNEAETNEADKKNTYIVIKPDLQTLVLRSRRESDKLTIKTRGCTKSIKKLLYEAHIPVEKRNTVAIVADKDGVIYADGFGIDSSRYPAANEEIMFIKTGWVNNE